MKGKMKMTRRIIAAALICCMAATVLAGCSAQGGEASQTSGTLKTESSASEESSEEKSDKADESKEEESSKAEESSEQESSEEESSGQESSEEEADDEVPEIYQLEAGFGDDDMTFITNGGLVTLGDNMADVIAKIGKASSSQKAPSCIGQGEITSYSYDGFDIETYDSPEGEKVLDIIIKGKNISTMRGINVGMTMYAITEVYGEPAESDEYFCTYKASNGMHLDFQLDNGKIIEIDYIMDLS